MNDYDPKIPMLRQMLALSIVNKLDECGFELLPNPREAFGLSPHFRLYYAKNINILMDACNRINKACNKLK